MGKNRRVNVSGDSSFLADGDRCVMRVAPPLYLGVAVGIAYYVVVSSILPELQATTAIGYKGEGSAVQFKPHIWKKFDRI